MIIIINIVDRSPNRDAHFAVTRVSLGSARPSDNQTPTAMGKKRGGQKKAEGKKWTTDPKPRREVSPVAAIEPFRPAARCVRRRAPVAHRGSGDGTPRVGASERIPPETQLIGVAVRRATPGDGTFMYGEVLEYNAKANRFLARFVADESESDEHFALMTYAEIIRDRVGSERSDDGLDMDAPYCLPCNTKTLWVLDLFSCLKSVERGLEDVLRDYRRKGWSLQVVHLDMDRRRDPDVLCDIRDWKKELVDDLGFRPFDFHIIWMSPDCRFFSQAGNPTSADIAHGVELVAAARDACEYFKPNCFFLENPWCGPRCLRKQDVVEDLLPFHVECCYCMYSEDGIMKPTSIFTNVPNLVLDFCSAGNPCHWLKAGHSRHRRSAQRGRSASGTPGSPLDMAIAVPKGLMVILMDAALRFITDTRLQFAAARRVDGAWDACRSCRSRGRKNWERRGAVEAATVM